MNLFELLHLWWLCLCTYFKNICLTPPFFFLHTSEFVWIAPFFCAARWTCLNCLLSRLRFLINLAVMIMSLLHITKIFAYHHGKSANSNTAADSQLHVVFVVSYFLLHASEFLWITPFLCAAKCTCLNCLLFRLRFFIDVTMMIMYLYIFLSI